MVETLVLKAAKRIATGTRFARRQRKEGQVPAVIYGHKSEPVSVLLNYHDLALELQHHHRLLEVELEGKREKFLLKDVQYDYLGDTIIHVDFVRVSMDERVEVTVEVKLKGTPAGAADGGILEQMLTDIHLECLVTNIPESVTVRVNDLALDGVISAGDIELPKGAKLLTDTATMIATVRIPSETPEEIEEAEAGEGDVEPEVIGRDKPEEETEEK